MTESLTEKTQAHLRALLSIKRRLQQEGICTEAVEAALLALATPASPLDRTTAEGALVLVNGIRNSIIGLQTMDWSEHIYPLVAALEDAGCTGMPYPEARANYGTTLQRAVAAEDRLETTLTALHGLAVRIGLVDASVAWDGPVLLAAVGSYLDASGPGGEVPPCGSTPNLATAARALLAACIEDFGPPDDRNDEFRDDGAVALGGSGPVAVTFAMMRDLQDALDAPTTSSEATP